MSANVLRSGEIVSASAARLCVADGRHPYEVEHSAAIEANWRMEKARQPALFDGQVVLFERLLLENGRLAGCGRLVRFATFLHWRASGRRHGAHHAYANAIPVTRDNRLIAVEMAAHTANPGRIYFPSGSFDRDDVHAGRIDVAGNMIREVREETGLAFAGLACERTYSVLPLASGTVIAKRVLLEMTGDEAQARIERFVASQRQPEIARPVVIDGPLAAGAPFADQMALLVDWHFANPVDTNRLERL